MARKKSNFFLNIMTSGKYQTIRDEKNMDRVVRYILLNFLIFMGGSLLFGFAYNNYAGKNYIEATVDFFMGCTTVAAFFILRTETPFSVSAAMTVIPFGFLCAFFFFSGGTEMSGIFWSFTFPMMAIFLLQLRAGTVLSILLWIFMAVSAFLPNFSPITFAVPYASRILSVYLLIFGLTIVYEQTRLTKDKWVARLTASLKEERDTITAMKDNLSVGLFLMNEQNIIQGQYSRALENILADTSIEGKDFTELLSSSLKQREIDTLKDYFAMVIAKSYDDQMLADINPLHQFEYCHPVNGTKKTLRSLFTSLVRDNGEKFVLATLSDATREAELQTQLAAEEEIRNAEMQTMFEIIHVEPNVLDDFIEDSDYEFERINSILKNRTISSRDVMSGIYQSVHAVKSNAVILGLESFSEKLHTLEEEIKTFRDRDGDVTFDNVLHITFEIERIMKLEDSFKDIIERIKSFTHGSQKMQEDYVFIEVLKRTAQKAADASEKFVILNTAGLDSSVVNGPYRREFKEILVQLVRNSVYHGIEKPDDRQNAGKEREGHLTLSILFDQQKYVIEYSDDGHGLDFASIAQKAVEKKLIRPDQISDKSLLTRVLFSSGFSTAESAGMYAGRGVGLDLVRSRVKELGGTIKLQSEPNKGTKFIITVPAVVKGVAAVSAG